MPITPFHLGPGALFKAVGGHRFSFMVFGGAQVLMDIEPLIAIIQGRAVLHGDTHTLAGALLIGIVAGMVGKPVSAFVLEKLGMLRHPLTWQAAFTGAFAGTFSHIVFDALMHADMRPWWPLADQNGLLGLVPLGTLHVACLALAGIGGALVFARAALAERALDRARALRQLTDTERRAAAADTKRP